MGFFGDLGKAFMGKPLDSTAQGRPPEANGVQPGNGVVDASGRKIIPDIDIKNLRSDRQGDDKLIVKAYIANNSDHLVRIDTSYLLKQKRTHNQQINPRDSREITLYDGKIPNNENERNAQIAYRLQVNGDVFMESYRIDYGLESDGKRVIEELHDDGPVRDI